MRFSGVGARLRRADRVSADCRITVDHDPPQSQHAVNGASHSDAALDCWSMILFRNPVFFRIRLLYWLACNSLFPFGGEANRIWPQLSGRPQRKSAASPSMADLSRWKIFAPRIHSSPCEVSAAARVSQLSTACGSEYYLPLETWESSPCPLPSQSTVRHTTSMWTVAPPSCGCCAMCLA